ncbi:maleate cis-trans isomerase family protein [Virgibacillus sp. W0181]|uniref:maleate cis-trans isomerase family protein n=1 Tax=Virgibacillus sp. W0181 TaxID=3391581 RepID=UPI003F45423A
MYGWRARVGLILPMDNAVMEPELNKIEDLDGIEFYGSRLNTNKRENMPENGIQLSKVFNELGTDIIVYSCAETAFLKGVDGNKYIADQITKLTNQPAISAMSSKIEALNHLNIKNIALVTPYTDERTKVMLDFFERMGITVSGSESKDFVQFSEDKREWYECNVQPPHTAYQMAMKANTAEAEAIVISATNFRTFEIIKQLEEDTGKPVITTNQAILWSVINKLSLGVRLDDYGKLLANI